MTNSADIDVQIQSLMVSTGFDEDTVRRFLAAQDQSSGEDTGTVRFDPASGAIAHRVLDRGIPKWRISHPTDGMKYEMTPTKHDWVLISTSVE